MTAICSKCGRDCKTALALGKHETKCGAVETKEYEFYDRHSQLGEKCPKCNEVWRDFLILDESMWVCLVCGCIFMPKLKLNKVNKWKAIDTERRLNEAKNRVCGQTEAPAEVKGVSENPTS